MNTSSNKDVYVVGIAAVEVTTDEEYSKADFTKFKSLRSAFKKDGEWDS